MNKYIFLDVDGVMNHETWYKSVNYKEGVTTEEYEKSQFCNWTVEILNNLTDKTGAKIVVSSSWRKGKSIDELKKLFESVGITGEVVGKTPVLYFTGLDNYNCSVPRGNEIKAWLETSKDLHGQKMSEIKYVIFDDDSDMLYWQRNNFIWVDPYAGLTKNLAYKAEQILLGRT